MQLKEIQSREEISQTYDILQQIYQNLEQKSYVENILNMMQRGYKMAGVFESNICIGVIGIRVMRKLQFDQTLEIEDFMIDYKKRGIGVGKMLMRWADWQAMTFDCKHIIGNLQTKRQESQQIFSREKFLIDGFSFKKTN